jgi:hypothetical protein
MRRNGSESGADCGETTPTNSISGRASADRIGAENAHGIPKNRHFHRDVMVSFDIP